MEPPVRGARAEPAIAAPPRTPDPGLLKSRNYSHTAGRYSPPGGPPGTEFLDAETGGQKSTQETANAYRDRKSGTIPANIPTKRPIWSFPGNRGSVGLGGGDHLDQTANSPRSHRTSLRNSSQERNFLLQRPRGEMASFGSIAGAETALTREFGRHAFEIAAQLRVSRTVYNFRVWVVGAPGLEPGTR